jgi:hypothetical protein
MKAQGERDIVLFFIIDVCCSKARRQLKQTQKYNLVFYVTDTFNLPCCWHDRKNPLMMESNQRESVFGMSLLPKLSLLFWEKASPRWFTQLGEK